MSITRRKSIETSILSVSELAIKRVQKEKCLKVNPLLGGICVSVSSSSSLLFLFFFFSVHTETEVTKQMTLPTENGHAAPPVESRKSCQSVNPDHFVFSNGAEGVTKLTTPLGKSLAW